MSKMPLSITRDVQMIMSLLVLLVMLLSSTTTATRAAATWTNRSSINITKPGCRDRCGDTIVPYPFGMDRSNCYFDKPFEVTCNMSYNPPIPFFSFYEDNDDESLKVLEFTFDYVRVNAPVRADFCFNNMTNNRDRALGAELYGFQTPPSFGFSYTRNKFTVVGCDIFAYMVFDEVGDPNFFVTGFASLCFNETALGNLSSCLGSNGCCQSSIPKGMGRAELFVSKMAIANLPDLLESKSNLTSYPCGHVFLVDKDFSGFNKILTSRDTVYVPVILDWAIGHNTCEEVRTNHTLLYACGKNTDCEDSKTGPGYYCKCRSKGYRGNPYLGCQDVDECKESNECLKETKCENTEGSYLCHCPPGHKGDGRKTGTGCRRDKRRAFLVVVIASGIGTSIFLIIVPTISFLLYRRLKQRKQMITRQKHFKRNGGLLLKQSISSHDGRVEHAKIFITEELERATDNFNQGRIIGKGGYGTVYKGMLSDGRIVAIKKSNIVDESQVDQFINEVIVLSQINHRHIVKLLGCCLETQVPFLVYEFVSNKTLSYHLHDKNREFFISWKDRLRIAAEVAGALAYLHSDALVPIFHRDIKSSNILLDDNYKAKLSDFGTSRLITSENTHLTTKVQGTFGYLDPEYFRSSQFTEKSDVYSFGVILVELLTGERAVSLVRSEEQISLVWHFTSSMRDNRLFEILDTQVDNEGEKADILVVAKLAKKCLKLNGKKRPTMKEVTSSLNGLTKLREHSLVDQEKFQNEDDYVIDDLLSPNTSGTFE